ncbi:ATP-binding protein [Streptomyces sp. NBC_01353]|uniref:ATP-binding protein n=1 Tax=Streptomyces sp. NBC_01353 TaxID=2903835 RepID=UPI002E361434|nr:ATP-binding protein [Streptomyces sp. NBC_01353]
MASEFDDMEADVADSFDVHLIPVGPVAGFPDGDTVSEAERTAAVLRRMGGEAVDPVFAGRAVESLTDADEALAHWAGERPGDDESRPSALLWFGHGRAATLGAVLLVPGSKERGDARVTPEMVAHYVHAEQRRREQNESHWALVMVEACNSENFARDVACMFNGSKQPRTRSLLLIATGKPEAQGYLGTFRKVLERYLDTKTSLDEVFTLRDLQGHFIRHRVYAELVGGETSAELRLVLRDRVPLAGATTVADLRRQQNRFDEAPDALPLMPAPDKVGFLEVVHDFTGRTADLRTVASWCVDPAATSVLAVTGAPGAGKSALLGETLRRWSHRRAEDGDIGPAPRIVAVLPLTGSTPEDVVRRLADTLDAHPGGGDVLDAVRRRLTELSHGPGAEAPALLVADALDEARDPVPIAALLRDLATTGVRLLIGTRPSPLAGVAREGRPADDSGHVDLLELLGSATGHARVLTLAPDPSAARDYAERNVREILREHPTSDDAWHESVAGTVADAVEAHVRTRSWQFLQAALVVQEIGQRPGVLSPGPDGRTALAQMLERDQSGIFGAAVQRITAGLPTAEPLLRALAYAHGRGLPLADGIWARAAAGIAGADAPFDDDQVGLFLNRAAAYVLVDGEDRRSVFRLAHRTHTEQLLGDGTPDRRYEMLLALLDLAAAQAGAGQPLSPHLATRLAEYAADCGAPGWSALAERPTVVDRLPPASLSALALTPGPGTGTAPTDLPIEVLGTVASAHLIKESEPDDRPGLRQLGGLRAAGRTHDAGPGAAWEVAWGRVRRVPLHLRLGGADTVVTTLVTRPESAWLVTGSLDGSVMAWEPWREHHPTLLLSGCESPVTALAALGSTAPPAGNAEAGREERGDDETGGARGPGLLAVAHDDRTLQLWDTDAGLGTGDAAERPEPHTTSTVEVVRVMAAVPDGTRRFVVAGEAGYLALLGPDGTLSQPGEAISAGDVVGLVTLPGPDGAPLVVVAYRSGLLGLWAVGGTVPAPVHRTSSRTALAGLVCVSGPTGADRLITVTDDGRLAHWRVSTGDDGPAIVAGNDGALPGVRGADPVLAALPTAEHGAVPVVGDRQGSVRVVRPTAAPGRPAFLETSTGSRAITAIGALRGPQGGSVLVTAAERDSTVHFWDPSAAARAGDAPAGRMPSIRDLRPYVSADGTETLVVTERSAGQTTVRVLRASDGAELDVPAPSGEAEPEEAPLPQGADDQHSRTVGCVALGAPVAPTRPARLRATAGREGTVVVWREEPRSGWRPVRRIPLGSPCTRLAPLPSGPLAVATDDGFVVLRLNPVVREGDGGGTEETDG